MIKRIILILLSIACMFSLTGCWNSIEIDKMDIVSAIAVDKANDGNKYTLCAEIIDLNKEAEKPSKILEASADTLFDATREMISMSTRKLYYGHCKIVIIGENAAKEGIVPIIDILMRFFSSRISLDVLVSKGTEAKKILELSPIRKSPTGFEINTLLDNDRESLSHSNKTELFTLINELGSEGVCAALPAIEITKVKDKDMYKLDGVAVFNKDKLVNYLDGDETKYFLFATDNMKGAPLSVKVNEEKDLYISTQILINKTKTKYALSENKRVIKLSLKTVVNIAEIGSINEFKDDDEHTRLKQLLQKNIEEKVKSTVEKVQKEYGCDIFGFGRQIKNNSPELWKKYKGDWQQTFKEFEIEVSSNVQIINKGNIRYEIEGEV